MPALVRLTLNFVDAVPIEYLKSDKLHAVFFNLFREDFAHILHSTEPFKPFSLNFLVRNEKSGNYENIFSTEIQKTHRLIIEAGLLDDSLIPKFTYSFIFAERPDYNLGKYAFEKGGLVFRKVIPYKELLNSARKSRKVLIKFVTPTSFKTGNKINLLPDPKTIFSGLIKKWKHFSNVNTEENLLELINQAVIVSGYELKTQKVELESMGWFTGFSGKLYLNFQTNEEHVLRWINALLDFSEFCGIGRKTTMGFGKVKIFKLKTD